MPLPPKAWPEVLVHLSLAQIPVLSMENGGLQSCKGFAEGQSRAGQVLPPKHTPQTLSLNLPSCFNQPELPVGCFSIHRSFPAQPPLLPLPKRLFHSHRRVRLEGTTLGHLVPPPCSIPEHRTGMSPGRRERLQPLSGQSVQGWALHRGSSASCSAGIS